MPHFELEIPEQLEPIAVAPPRVEVSRTKDARLVKKVLTHPRVYPWITDDSRLPAEEWEPPMADSVLWLAMKSQGELIGVGGFLSRSGITLEMHFAFLPEGYGLQAREGWRAMTHWIVENTVYRRLVGEVSRSNVLARRYLSRMGCEVYGINRRSILRNGLREDQLCFALELK